MKRIGLVGCGNWGRLILRDLVACGAEVHVVAPTAATRQRALSLGARSAHTDVSAISDVDGFVVATPTSLHAAALDSVLPLRRPVFVEKALTADVASARRLAASAEGRLFVMDKWRYHSGIEAMRAEIASGRVGEVLAIRTLRSSWGNPHPDVSALWILAPHDLAIALHLLGGIPPLRSAFAVSTHEPDLGIVANFGGDRGPTITLDLGIASHEHRRRVHVIGSLATMELRDGYDERIFVREGPTGASGAPARAIEVGNKMPLLAELQAFLAFLSGGPPPMSSAAEGLLIVERVAAIEDAIKGANPTAV